MENEKKQPLSAAEHSRYLVSVSTLPWLSLLIPTPATILGACYHSCCPGVWANKEVTSLCLSYAKPFNTSPYTHFLPVSPLASYTAETDPSSLLDCDDLIPTLRSLHLVLLWNTLPADLCVCLLGPSSLSWNVTSTETSFSTIQVNVSHPLQSWLPAQLHRNLLSLKWSVVSAHCSSLVFPLLKRLFYGTSDLVFLFH